MQSNQSSTKDGAWIISTPRSFLDCCGNVFEYLAAFCKKSEKSFFLELLQCLELSLFSSSNEKGWQNKREEGETIEKMERKKEKRNKRGKRSGGSSRKSKKRERREGDVLYTAPSCPEKGTEVEGLSPPPPPPLRYTNMIPAAV